MNIAVNTRLLIRDKLEGIGVFAHETLSRIARRHKEHQFIYIFDRPFDEWFIQSDNITPVVAGPATRHPFLWYYWLRWSLPEVLRKRNAGLFLSPDGFMPVCSTGIPAVNVIHDLNFEFYPNDLPFFTRRFYRKYFPRFARSCSRLATVSEYSRKSIVNTYHVSEEKIDVVYNGAKDSFGIMDETRKKEIRQKYAGGLDYFLYVGSLHPRKNIPRLLQAYEEYRSAGGKRMKLLLCGRRMSWDEGAYGLNRLSFAGDILFTGYLPDAALADVMAAACSLVYVPYFEGFGIPLVESMRCGVPVITSNKTSLPEVAGDAALFADPFSVGSISDAMLKMSKDEKLRSALIAKGIERSKMFNWDKTAELLWNSMEKAIA